MDLVTGTALLLTSGSLPAGVVGLAALARARYRLERRPDATLRLRTADGWNLRVLHYRPRRLPAFAEPVVLCHGFAANSFNLDLDDRHSLARHLAGEGFHAFVPDLRGRAGSWPDRRARRHDYTFDDHALFDAPTVLDGALAATGARRAFWVGHSMGGMLGYVTAARLPARLAGVVTLGSPARLQVDDELTRLVRLALQLPFDPLPQRLFAQAAAPFATETFPPGPDFSAHRPNMERRTIRYALANVVVDVPRRLLRQFADWAALGEIHGGPGGEAYGDQLRQVRAPLLVVAGNADRLAPPDHVRPGHDLARSDDRTFLVLGDEPATAGRRFGHGDLVLGRDAPELVFPQLARWLADRATRADRRSFVVAPGLAG